MKYFLLVFLISTLLFMNCDGRKSQNESLQEAISEFNNKQKELKQVSFFPENYVEIATDSLIENTFYIRIKNYTLMNDEVVINLDKKRDKIEYQRSFESEIKVFDDSKLIFNSILNAKTFVYNTPGLFWDNATLEHVWVNQELSNKDRVNLDVSFVNPKTKSYKLYQLCIDRNGNYKMYLKEEQS